MKPDMPAVDWHVAAHARLDKARQLSPRLEFNDGSRLVFFSDCHRGTNNRYDAFAPNAALFLHALTHYYHQGFTYIEVGDGDELWHNPRFSDIRHAHRRLFDLLFRFWEQNRLVLIIGNHDSQGGLFDPMEKEGIPLHQGLLLTHTTTGQTLFAVHGHQASYRGDYLWWFKRPHSRYFFKHLLPLGIHAWYYFAEPEGGVPERHRLDRIPLWLSEWILNKAHRVETAIQLWSQRQQQVVICGHTHMCAFPTPGRLPYFNTGNCLTPGYITGLEIFQGQITLIKWTAVANQVQRHILQTKPLTLFHHKRGHG